MGRFPVVAISATSPRCRGHHLDRDRLVSDQSPTLDVYVALATDPVRRHGGAGTGVALAPTFPKPNSQTCKRDCAAHIARAGEPHRHRDCRAGNHFGADPALSRNRRGAGALEAMVSGAEKTTPSHPISRDFGQARVSGPAGVAGRQERMPRSRVRRRATPPPSHSPTARFRARADRRHRPSSSGYAPPLVACLRPSVGSRRA